MATHGVGWLYLLIQENSEFKSRYIAAMKKYYEYAEAELPKIDEIIAYFESKAMPITQNGVVKAMYSLKAVSTAN